MGVCFLGSVGSALAAGLLTSKKRVAAGPGLIVLSFFCAGIAVATVGSRRAATDSVAEFYEKGWVASGEPVELTGVLEREPEAAPESFYLTLRAESLRYKGIGRDASGTVLLLARVRDSSVQNEYERLGLHYGARVSVMTSLTRADNFRNPGVSSFTEYLERKGYDATGLIKSPLLVERLDDQLVFLPLAWIYQTRAKLLREINSTFSPETAGVLDAALLGDRYFLSHGTAERFRAGGTFHVLVISGLHISFIGGIVFLLMRRLTRRLLWQFLVSAGILWGYVLAVGAEASVVRAALMFTLVALAPLVARRAQSLNLLGGTALGLLVLQPGELFDPSFQLTFLSVLMIVTLGWPLLQRMQAVGAWQPTRETPCPPFCPRWLRSVSEILFWSGRKWQLEMAGSNFSYRLFKAPLAVQLEKRRVQRLSNFAFGAVVISASVQLGLLPVLVLYFHRLSIASFILNIGVGVLMAVLGLIALATLGIKLLSTTLALLLAKLAAGVNWVMVHSVDPFSHLAIASVRLPEYTGWASAIYGLYYIPLAVLIFALARWNPLQPSSREPGRLRATRFKWFAAGSLGLVLCLIVFHPFSSGRIDGRLHLDFLDVGQGDSALLTMPDGTTLLIDGGGRPSFNRRAITQDEEDLFVRDTRSVGEAVVSEYLWWRGLDRVDYILATHADADHIDGLSDVAKNFHVRGAIVGRAPADDPEFRQFIQTTTETGLPLQVIGAGDVLRFGEVTAEALSPTPVANTNAPSRNNDSVVLRLRYGAKTFLLAGDIEKETEGALLNEGVNLRSDVVKVAHHGSRTSSIASFVTATHPSLAIISVGRTSVFGHPHKEVVERWRDGGAEVLTTGQRGTITISTDGRTITLETYCDGVRTPH
ncbi:MAG: ComEC/Rec2 family competence protein [Pyrinomonadaceae bacterium]